ncbi:MAG: phosphoribosylformylglycinamidine synthase subunit PurS [Acidimicrobiales bacterium]|nr:MAG: phosphoribosylformylglycinamidine synthase subunit PurS [Acidimicrobiales bacterium]
MKFSTGVTITLKNGLADPEGATIERALPGLGFDGVSNVRVGKHISLVVDAPDAEAASALVSQLCERLLANPVIEDYSFELRPVEDD